MTQEATSKDYALGYAEGFNDACKKPTWVGLTDREFEEATHGMEDLEDCWKAIEDALRKKNNA